MVVGKAVGDTDGISDGLGEIEGACVGETEGDGDGALEGDGVLFILFIDSPNRLLLAPYSSSSLFPRALFKISDRRCNK